MIVPKTVAEAKRILRARAGLKSAFGNHNVPVEFVEGSDAPPTLVRYTQKHRYSGKDKHARRRRKVEVGVEWLKAQPELWAAFVAARLKGD